MRNKFEFRLDHEVNSFNFYNSFLPKLHKSLSENKKRRKIVFDFTDVEFINPLTLPNLLTVGLILKEYYQEPAEIFIPWKPRLLSYLADIKFLDIARNIDLYILDERYIGGFKLNQIQDEFSTYVFGLNDTKESIRQALIKSSEVIKHVVTGKVHSNSNNDININVHNEEIGDVIDVLVQFCFNAIEHGNSSCFAVLQTNYGRNVKYKKAYIAISDCGIGFSKSFEVKVSEEEYRLLFMPNDKCNPHLDILSILEAVFFHKFNNFPDHGIYEVVSAIVKSNGIVRIHSNTSQLIFTNYNFKRIEKELVACKYDSKKTMIMIERWIHTYNSPIRKIAKFKGVHIEIEVPISLKKGRSR